MKTVIRRLGVQPYGPILEAMRDFTDQRTEETPDELWFLEHEAVFTLGQAGKKEHILNAHEIPVVQSCRGGQVTYHAPGQLIVYTLVDLKRRHLGVKQWVCHLEQTVIQCLAHYGIDALTQPKAPGVYLNDGRKIASLGLRVRKGACYHGLSLNVRMDLEPFQYINPCGYAGLEMTQLSEFLPDVTMADVQKTLEELLA